MSENYFENLSPGLDSPGTRHFDITPSASYLAVIPRSLKVKTGGALIIEDVAGVQVSYPVSDGEVFPFSARKVLVGTTAVVVGWY